MRHALFVLLLLPMAARAAEPEFRLDYTAYVAGLEAFSLRAEAALSAEDYRIRTSYRTLGLVDLFFHADVNSTVQGQFDDPGVWPQRFRSWGRFRGTDRQTLIDYPDHQPEVRVVLPPPRLTREPVPPAAQRDTIDTLSAVALLVRQVTERGTCDGHARIFDGQRLSEVTSHTAGREVLAPEHGAPFTGPAVRCDFTGRMLGGYRREEDRDRQAEPREGSAWIAPPAAGMPPLPVRIRFGLRPFGSATMYLEQAASGP